MTEVDPAESGWARFDFPSDVWEDPAALFKPPDKIAIKKTKTAAILTIFSTRVSSRCIMYITLWLLKFNHPKRPRQINPQLQSPFQTDSTIQNCPLGMDYGFYLAQQRITNSRAAYTRMVSRGRRSLLLCMFPKFSVFLITQSTTGMTISRVRFVSKQFQSWQYFFS